MCKLAYIFLGILEQVDVCPFALWIHKENLDSTKSVVPDCEGIDVW